MTIVATMLNAAPEIEVSVSSDCKSRFNFLQEHFTVTDGFRKTFVINYDVDILLLVNTNSDRRENTATRV